MSWFGSGDNSENEDGSDVEGDNDEFKTFEDQIVFLIDASEPMGSCNAHGEIHLVNSLRVALAVFKSKIIASAKTSVGIIFFNTLKKDTSGNSVHTLFNLEPPTASRMQQLHRLCENPSEFKRDIGYGAITGTIPLKEGLWKCSEEFGVRAKKSTRGDYKRVWIFTNTDNPNSSDKIEQNRTVQVSKDCAETGIEISLWHMNDLSAGNSGNFDVNKFYTRLLVADEDELHLRVKGSGDEGFSEMLAHAKRKEHKKRRMNTLKCHIGKANASETTLMLQIYKTIAPSTKSAQANLHSLTNLPLKTVSRNIDASTGKVLEDDEISTYLETLGRRVYLARKEINDLKQLGMSGEASMTILYFINAKALRPEFNCCSPYFISADDKIVRGSTHLSHALLYELMTKELIAVASFMLTKSGKPKMVALLPQGEVVDDDDGQQILPPGMNVISLPYLSELRHSSTPEHVLSARAAVTDEAVESAIEFIKTWQVEAVRNIEDFENPSLQCFFSGLQAIALSQSSTDWVGSRDDQMQPQLSSEAVSKIEELKILVDFDNDDSLPAAGSKRTANKKTPLAENTSGGARKKSRGDDIVKDESLAPKDYSRYTAAELKDMCKSKGLKVTGTKADLTARLLEES